MLEKIARYSAIVFGLLFICASLLGIIGVWFVDRKATEVVLNGFRLIETGVGVVDAGVGRVGDLVTRGRTEVRQAAETIIAVGAQAQANGPVLKALNERLDNGLAPDIAQIQQALAPVRDAVGTIGNAVSLLNSIPMIADRAPRLAAVDEAFDRLEALSQDATQLRSTLRELVLAQKDGDIARETVATLNGLAQRIDTRLGEVQNNIHGVQSEIDALQVRIEARKSRLLFLFNLLALLLTLMLGWILYTQVVVIRHHWTRMRRPAAKPPLGGDELVPAVD